MNVIRQEWALRGLPAGWSSQTRCSLGLTCRLQITARKQGQSACECLIWCCGMKISVSLPTAPQPFSQSPYLHIWSVWRGRSPLHRGSVQSFDIVQAAERRPIINFRGYLLRFWSAASPTDAPTHCRAQTLSAPLQMKRLMGAHGNNRRGEKTSVDVDNPLCSQGDQNSIMKTY